MNRKTKELKESCKCHTLSLKRINVSCHKRNIISESESSIKLANHTSHLYIRGFILPATDKLKYLGVIIDDTITSIPHIT